MSSFIVLMGGFIDPQKLLVLLGTLLIMFVSFVCGLICLIVSIVKAKKSGILLNTQKTFTFALISFFITFVSFVFMQTAFK